MRFVYLLQMEFVMRILSIVTINTFSFVIFLYSLHVCIDIFYFSLIPTAASLFSSPIFATTRSFSLPNFPLLTTAHSPGWLRGEVCAELLRPPVTSLTVNTPNHLLLLLETPRLALCFCLILTGGFVELVSIWCSSTNLCK